MDRSAQYRTMAEGDGRTGGPDTRILQDLIGDLADAASYLEAAAEGLAEHRNGQYDVGVLVNRLDAIDAAIEPLIGGDSLLVRVSVLEHQEEGRKESKAEMIALVAVLIALGGLLFNLVVKLVP